MEHQRERQQTQRQEPWAKQGHGPAARIDDVLVERHALRTRIENLLDGLPSGRKPTRRLLNALEHEARSEGLTSARALIELYLEAASARKARLLKSVLEQMPLEELAPAIKSLAEMQPLTPQQATDLDQVLFRATAKAQKGKELKSQPEETRVFLSPPEMLEAFLQSAETARATEPEALALVWLYGFKDLPADVRISVLSALGQRPDPSFLPILELEARSASAEVRRVVATLLPKFRYEESLHLALELRFDEDVIVRYDAGRAQETLQAIKNLPRAAAPPEFDHSYCIALPSAGIVGVLYAARDEGGCIKFCSILIDTWHRGIVDCWGNVDCTDDQFSDVLLAFASRISSAALTASSVEPQFDAISRAEALELIREGARLTARRGRKLPAEYPIWARLFRHEEVSEADTLEAMRDGSIANEFVFDLHCAGCTRPIAVNRQRTNLAISGGQAFCKRCLCRDRKCNTCGKGYRLAGLSARRISSAATHAVCSKCLPR